MSNIVEHHLALQSATLGPLEWRPVPDWTEADPLDKEDLHSENQSDSDEDEKSNGNSKDSDDSSDSNSSASDTSDDESCTREVLEAFHERDCLLYPSDVDQLVYRTLDKYELVKFLLNKIGRKVYVMRSKTDPKELVAVTCHKDCLPKLQKDHVPREVQILQRLKGAPHLSQLKEWALVEEDMFVTVVPYYKSFDIRATVAPSLYLVSNFMKQLLQAIEAMHERKVVHRDVAVDNITWDPIDEQLHLIDFDCAAFDRPEGFYAYVGRDDYYAPEMEEATARISSATMPYDKRVDIYAAGVILYMLLTNSRSPPSRKVLRKYLKKIRKRESHKKYPYMNLMESMLRYDRNQRIKLQDALKHPFICETKPDEPYQKMRKDLDDALAKKSEINLVNPEA